MANSPYGEASDVLKGIQKTLTEAINKLGTLDSAQTAGMHMVSVLTGNLDELKGLLADTQKQLATARQKLADAKAEAATIISNAHTERAAMISEATAEATKLRTETKRKVDAALGKAGELLGTR